MLNFCVRHQIVFIMRCINFFACFLPFLLLARDVDWQEMNLKHRIQLIKIVINCLYIKFFIHVICWLLSSVKIAENYREPINCLLISVGSGCSFILRKTNIFKMTVEVATYHEIIESIVDQEVLLIDVRDPQEIAATGSIPTSINIPRI